VWAGQTRGVAGSIQEAINGGLIDASETPRQAALGRGAGGPAHSMECGDLSLPLS
jgi:hypothetical protein